MKVPAWAKEAIKEASNGSGEFESWDPEPGDVLSGRVVRWDSVDTKYGERPTLRVQAGDTEYGVLVARVALKTQLERAAKKIGRERLEPGDEVVIVYQGMRASAKTGNEYADYVAAARIGKGSDDGLPF